ncbi:hypothetical protein OROMI_020837 [Orobanche minor]
MHEMRSCYDNLLFAAASTANSAYVVPKEYYCHLYRQSLVRSQSLGLRMRLTLFHTTSPPPSVFGCVIGVQRGRTVGIFNNFELLFDESTQSLDRALLLKKQELYKKVFPNFYILRWYSTGSDAQESDMIIHKSPSDCSNVPIIKALRGVLELLNWIYGLIQPAMMLMFFMEGS